MAGGTATTIWILPGWSRTFERNVLFLRVFVAAPLSVACAAYSGLAWLLVFFVAFWPFPYRTRWSSEALEVTWLFLSERLPFAEIESARVRSHFQHLLIFRYAIVLDLQLADGRRAVIKAPRPTLEALHSQIAAALAARASM
jgi:hypothetical protein